jgi:hypothetical protein
MLEYILPLFIGALIIAIYFMIKSPKIAISPEFELVENEIQAWLRNPEIICGVRQTNAEAPDWTYPEIGIGRVRGIGQTAMGSELALSQNIYGVD